MVGFVASKARGTVAIMVDEASFNEIVSAMSGGAITPKLGDSLSMSVLGSWRTWQAGKHL